MSEIPRAAVLARQMYAEGKPVDAIRAETSLTLNRLYYWLDGGNGRLPPIGTRGDLGGRRIG